MDHGSFLPNILYPVIDVAMIIYEISGVKAGGMFPGGDFHLSLYDCQVLFGTREMG